MMQDPKSFPRIVVVGPCASGKTTLVQGLKDCGLDAVVCSQEHSEIPTLWARSEPDVLVALNVDLKTIRRRRGEDWPDSIFQSQLERLRVAFGRANVTVDTAITSPEETLRLVLAAIREAAPIDSIVAIEPDN